jgi:hypothetical protein
MEQRLHGTFCHNIPALSVRLVVNNFAGLFHNALGELTSTTGADMQSPQHPVRNFLVVTLIAILAAVILMLLAPTPAHGQPDSQQLPYCTTTGKLLHAQSALIILA